jgi:signal transduction histidine kinase
LVDKASVDSLQGRSLIPVSSYRHRTVALLLAAVGSAIGVIVQGAAWARDTPEAWLRLVAFLVIGVAAVVPLLRDRRTEGFLIVTGLVFGLLGLAETARMRTYETGTMLALLILLLVVYVTTRESQAKGPLILASGFTCLYTVVAVSLEARPLSLAVGTLLVGIPGQMLVVWITWRLIQVLGEASRQAAGFARIQQALATCSQALLSGRDEEPLAAALKALLDATEADYAYIDVNRVDRDGNISWEIVADAIGENVPPGPSTFDDGDYSQFSETMEALSAGRPARVRVSELPVPIRHRYEAEGIRSELMAPIVIRDQWVGTLGYTDFWRDDAWTDVEVDGLMRAADMVAAFWERESAREGLEELAEAKDRFIATVSHELRTPLAAVVGFSGELAQGLERYSREEIYEMVSLISSQSIEVAQLVDDLLTAERAASGNLTIKPSALDLLDETRSVVGSLRADFAVSVDGEPVSVWADTLRTRQIVRNLLTNALRYGGPTVRVEISTRGDQAILVVTDDGPGVRGIDAEHIFDPYYRSKTEDTKPDSVGLGLAVARQLARLMGGDVVYLRRSGWTNFELSLPTVSDHFPAATVADPVR